MKTLKFTSVASGCQWLPGVCKGLATAKMTIFQALFCYLLPLVATVASIYSIAARNCTPPAVQPLATRQPWQPRSIGLQRFPLQSLAKILENVFCGGTGAAALSPGSNWTPPGMVLA